MASLQCKPPIASLQCKPPIASLHCKLPIASLQHKPPIDTLQCKPPLAVYNVNHLLPVYQCKSLIDSLQCKLPIASWFGCFLDVLKYFNLIWIIQANLSYFLWVEFIREFRRLIWLVARLNPQWQMLWQMLCQFNHIYTCNLPCTIPTIWNVRTVFACV